MINNQPFLGCYYVASPVFCLSDEQRHALTKCRKCKVKFKQSNKNIFEFNNLFDSSFSSAAALSSLWISKRSVAVMKTNTQHEWLIIFICFPLWKLFKIKNQMEFFKLKVESRYSRRRSMKKVLKLKTYETELIQINNY